MSCPCCVTRDITVIVDDKDITHMVSAVSVDTAPDVIREPLSNKCQVEAGQWMMMFGPGKTTVQITAYPWGEGGSPKPDMGGLGCATNVSISVPWKYIYDCRLDADCIDKSGKVSKKKGRWVLLPLKKKTITVTGDISKASGFTVDGCTIPAPKFSVQASNHQYYTPQETVQYSHLVYAGIPIKIDTDNLNTSFKVAILSGMACGGFPEMDAYLTGFTFSFQPPSQSSIVYNFEVPYSTCPGTCK